MTVYTVCDKKSVDVEYLSFNKNGIVMAKFNLHVNGKEHTVDVLPDTPLLWVLRDELNLVGTKFGCGIAQCGACTVHLNDTPVRSCSLPVSSIGAKKVVTIEGLSEKGDSPVQLAWDEADVPQCGYCQAGQIMTATALLKRNPKPNDKEIDAAMAGHICRCGTYKRIKQAIHIASAKTVK
jgi:isoquinoline 1-oxidoreductase alpha subunit